jgi:ribosome biogenesis protein Tsr3
LEEAEKKRADKEGKSKLFHFLCKKALYAKQFSKCDSKICGSRRCKRMGEAGTVRIETGDDQGNNSVDQPRGRGDYEG